jgi:uncharacterized protein YkwD
MKNFVWIQRFSLLAVWVGFLSCSPKMAVNASGSTEETVVAADNMESSILRYINQHRRQLGKPALQLQSIASQEATRHSRDMAKRKTGFGHEGFAQRMDVIKKTAGWISASAENVAYGKLSAQEVVKGWLNSPGHKKNIEGDYTFTGIGVYKDAKGIIFFTQIFYRK